jgi:hypothetical protein
MVVLLLQVRLAGGVEVLADIIKQRMGASKEQQQQQQHLQEVAGMVSAVLHLLSVLVADNSANKLALREAGGFDCAVVVLDQVLRQTAQPTG